MREEGEQPLALVLSGGGARGAYEAGVLRYALGKLAPRLGRSAVPRIFCGTSVGAINACALAARAELPDLGVRLLADRWQSLRLEDVFKLGWGDLTSIARWLVGKPADPRTLLARASRRQAASEQESLSSPLYLFGKLLDALLLDRVENDLANLRRVNAALRALTPVLLQDQELALALLAAGGAL